MRLWQPGPTYRHWLCLAPRAFGTPQQTERWALCIHGRSAALDDQGSEVLFQLLKFDDSLTDICELVLGQFPGLLAGPLPADFQQARDLVQGETHRLGTPDELKPRYLRSPVLAHTALGARRFREQPASLVVAHRFNMDIGRGGQSADSEAHTLDSVPWYGP
jgi:hypothetical protein